MSTLRSALDELRLVDVDDFTSNELKSELTRIQPAHRGVTSPPSPDACCVRGTRYPRNRRVSVGNDEAAALEDTNHAFGWRRLHVSPTLGGVGRVDGVLDPEGTETVLTASGAVLDTETRTTSDGDGDGRVPAQRRADALLHICRSYLDHTTTTTVAGERPHLTMIVDLEVLERRATQRAETAHGQILHPETVRRLACDAAVSRIITKGQSEPLNVGRRTRTIPPAIRRALVIRDRHRPFPRCDRPAPWCHGHHIIHWACGGPTCLDNLTLLCRRHYRLVHERDRSLNPRTDGPQFTNPDGQTRTNGTHPRDP